MTNQYFWDLHRWVSNALIFISYKGVHVSINFLDESLKFLSFNVRYIQEHQNESFLLGMFNLLKLVEYFIQRLIEVVVVMRTYDFWVGLSSTLALSCIGGWWLNNLENKFEILLWVLFSYLWRNSSDCHCCDRAYLL